MIEKTIEPIEMPYERRFDLLRKHLFPLVSGNHNSNTKNRVSKNAKAMSEENIFVNKKDFFSQMH